MSKRKRTLQTTSFDIPRDVLNNHQHHATIQQMHPNGRHTVTNTVKFFVPHKQSKVTQEDSPRPGTPDPPDDPSGPELPSVDPFVDEAVQAISQREFITLESDSVLRDWSQETGKFLDELLRLEGFQGNSTSVCPLCPSSNPQRPLYRCDDCFRAPVICADCCVTAHCVHPFHRIKKWTGHYFGHTTLQELGLVIQLGHRFGEICDAPGNGPAAAVVLHHNGFHPVTLRYCQCDQYHVSGDRIQQLLRSELYPATLTDPTTLCTFRLLEHFHMLTLVSKINATDFYTALERTTDNIGTGRSYDRLKPFLRCVREWRHLKMLKRSGRGYITDGTTRVGPGELCIPCLACPKPGFNLPADWENAPADRKFIYSLMIAIDANFRLKRRMVSNHTRDPALGSGWGYFVEDAAYREHVLNYADQTDISTCTGFAALEHANTKYSAGYATTGVAMCICARHGMILPNGVGDLQKGERYCNIDYIVMSVLKLIWTVVIPLLLSYDIVCQWFINVMSRLSEDQFPGHLRLPLKKGLVRTVIPKYHFNGHKEEDHNRFSLNLVPGVGRTDGEEIERNWFRHNATAASTREMGPGSRHDTLEDHFGWSNHVKSTGLGRFFKRKLKFAKEEHAKYKELYDQFTASLDPANVSQWLQDVDEWEADPSKPDPYFVAPSGLTEAQIRVELMEEEKAEAETGDASHKVSPLTMLVEMLEIEDQQRRFRLRFPKVNTIRNPLLVAEIIEKRHNLRRRLRALREWQALYMPPVATYAARYHVSQSESNSASSESATSRASKLRNLATAVAAEPANGPEHEPVCFPHNLTVSELDLCYAGLAHMESRLRLGQMRSALDKLRVQLHIKSRLLKFKAQNIRHQASNTRALGQLDTNEAKILGHAEKYRAARAAYAELEGEGDWEKTWRKLLAADVRLLRDSNEPTLDEEGTEGRRAVAWIWQGGDRHKSDEEAGVVPGIADALRGEFLRTRARALRYEEEIMLLEEEERRTLVSLEKHAGSWDAHGRQPERQVSCPILSQGMQVYAAKQAAVRRDLASMFQAMWYEGTVPTVGLAEDGGREDETDANGVGLQRTIVALCVDNDGDDILATDANNVE